MFIRYSEQARELEISANKEELIDLSHKITEHDLEINTKVLSKDMSAAPYSMFLCGIQVSILSGQFVEFQVTAERKVLIQGDTQKLSILSDVILSFAKDWSVGEHIHLEPYPGHFYLSPNSVSVIFVYT
jgi:hypothetical protein